jgi:hypothetical protein
MIEWQQCRIGSQPWTEASANAEVKINFSADADVIPTNLTGAP